jgi:F-type H+-transporting ATPase subunit b
MTPERRWLSVTLVAFLLVTACVVEPAVATEGGEQNPAETPIGTLFHWLNFLLVFGGAGYLLTKHGPAFFRGRADAIATSIAHAATAKAEAERRLREAEDKLKRLDQEVAEQRAAAQRASVAEAERIRALASDDASKIQRAALAEIEAAERAARTELKASAARLAVEHAEALIQKQITAATQASLFRFFLDDLSRSAN